MSRIAFKANATHFHTGSKLNVVNSLTEQSDIAPPCLVFTVRVWLQFSAAKSSPNIRNMIISVGCLSLNLIRILFYHNPPFLNGRLYFSVIQYKTNECSGLFLKVHFDIFVYVPCGLCPAQSVFVSS